jgi:sugar phosphate isomerase/epimerase
VKVYASTSCLGRGFWETLRTYRESGIHGVELGSTTEQLGDGLLDRLCAEGLEYVVHNYFPPPAEAFVLNLASPDEEIRRRSLRLVDEGLELAAALRSPLYSVHAGFVTDPVGFDGRSFVFAGGGNADRAKERFAGALEAALARAGELGVELLVENNVCTNELRGSVLLQTADEFDELPGFGILLDTGHLNVSARTLGFDRLDFVERLAPRIRAFHLHDNDGSADAHDPVAPGSWALEAVRRTEPVAVTVEARFANVEELHRHLDWLRAQL